MELIDKYHVPFHNRASFSSILSARQPLRPESQLYYYFLASEAPATEHDLQRLDIHYAVQTERDDKHEPGDIVIDAILVTLHGVSFRDEGYRCSITPQHQFKVATRTSIRHAEASRLYRNPCTHWNTCCASHKEIHPCCNDWVRALDVAGRLSVFERRFVSQRFGDPLGTNQARALQEEVNTLKGQLARAERAWRRTLANVKPERP